MRNHNKAEEVVQSIASTGSKATAIQVDVRKLEEVRALFEETIAQFGKVDILGLVQIRVTDLARLV